MLADKNQKVAYKHLESLNYSILNYLAGLNSSTDRSQVLYIFEKLFNFHSTKR